MLLMVECQGLMGSARHCQALGAASLLPTPYLKGPLHRVVALSPVPPAWKYSLPPAPLSTGHSLPAPVPGTPRSPFQLR